MLLTFVWIGYTLARTPPPEPLEDLDFEEDSDEETENSKRKKLFILKQYSVTMFSRGFLVGVRRKALRRGVWYTALDRVERGIIVLTSRVVDMVRSPALGVEIVKILVKLKKALKSGFVRRMEEFGLRRAREVARQAVEWGSGAAMGWASDLGFIRYLTLMDVNRPMGFCV